MNFYLIDGSRLNLGRVNYFEAFGERILNVEFNGERVQFSFDTSEERDRVLKQLDSAARVSELPVLVEP